MNFKDLGLSEKTIKAIGEFGIKKPTTIQIDVIPSILEGKDIFTIAPQQCGKTTSYVFPLVDIISRRDGKNILIITPSSDESVVVSDSLSMFNRYHEINEATIKDADEEIDNEANVIIASPDLLVEISKENKIDLSNINLLIVDDINLIKKNKQLDNLKTILEMLPSEKQNVVYTNRRSKETQEILDRILKAPEEIKVDKDKEQEVDTKNLKNVSGGEEVEQKPAVAEVAEGKKEHNNKHNQKNRREHPKQQREEKAVQKFQHNYVDEEAISLSKKYNSFGGNTPNFLLSKCIVVDSE